MKSGRSDGGSRLVFAHALRGVAALAVVASHYAGIFWLYPGIVANLTGAPPIALAPPGFARALSDRLPDQFLGHFGVALFFLISGFVIPFSLASRSRTGFAIARILRLWPTYAVGLTLTAGVVWLTARHFGNPVPFGPRTYVLQLLFVRDLAWQPSIDAIVWTLEIEAKFYLLCIILAPAMRAARMPVLLAAAAAIAVTTSAFALLPGWLSRGGWPFVMLYALSLSGQMLPFMLVGTICNFLHRKRVGAVAAAAAIAVLLVFFVMQWACGTLADALVPGLISYAVALLTFLAGFALRNRIQSVPLPVRWLADISYPLYVIHGVNGYVLMIFALRAGFSPLAAIAAALVAALALAAVLHIAIERPTQELGRRLSKPRDTAVEAELRQAGEPVL